MDEIEEGEYRWRAGGIVHILGKAGVGVGEIEEGEYRWHAGGIVHILGKAGVGVQEESSCKFGDCLLLDCLLLTLA